MQRALVGDDLTVGRSDTVLRWNGANHALVTRLTYLEADPEGDLPVDTSEWSLSASRTLATDWTGRVNWRYNFIDDDARDAGLGLTYRSECVTVDFDVQRQFTTRTRREADTRIDVGVRLAGIGGTDGRDRRRRCGI